MTKINLGLCFLIIVMITLTFLFVKMDNNFVSIMEQMEIINSKLDHLEYDLHEFEEK